jgi:hypothetical protein
LGLGLSMGSIRSTHNLLLHVEGIEPNFYKRLKEPQGKARGVAVRHESTRPEGPLPEVMASKDIQP